MGLEALCSARFGGRHSAGKARLEQKTLEFRGDFRLDIPLAEIRRADAKRGTLSVAFAGGSASFDLGDAAEKWALKIRYPKPVIEKLGVKQGMRIGVAGDVDRKRDHDFWREMEARAAEICDVRARGKSPALDLVFFFAAVRTDLARLAALEKQIARDGAIWVVYPKGVQPIREADVMAAAKQAKLVDVKIVSFSETHSALKMMVPVARR